MSLDGWRVLESDWVYYICGVFQFANEGVGT